MNTTRLRFRKGTFGKIIVFLVVVLGLLSVAFSGLFFNSAISAHASSATVATTHDEQLISYARIAMDANVRGNDLMAFGSASDSTTDSTTVGVSFEIDRIEVILKREYSRSAVDTNKFLQIPNIQAVHGVRSVSTENLSNDRFRQMLTLELETVGREQVIAAVAAAEQLNEVLVAQPSYIYEGGDDWALPDDPLYNGTGNRNQWGLRGANGIQAEAAWAFTNGTTTPNRIRVGIFETGVQANHTDLRVVANPNFAGGAAQNHGTHVAGIIGAITHNASGVAGVAQVDISLLNRNTFRASLEWAEAQGIRIVNASYWQDRPTVNTAGVVTRLAVPDANHMQAIANFPGLFIASAGNQGLDNDVAPQFPGGYNLPNLIAVGSIDNGGGISTFSNFGATSVHVFAPGGNILSTFPEGNWGTTVEGYTQVEQGYAITSGTSMATPMVAGVAALALAANPNLTIAQWRATIEDGVVVPTGTNPLQGFCSTNGRLNALRTVIRAVLTTTTSGGNVTITGITQVGRAYTGNFEIPDRIGGNPVTTIGASAFTSAQLSKITIPASVTSIASNSFSGCTSLESITVAANNANYASQDGILYNKAKTSFVHIPDSLSGNITIPNGITHISGFRGLTKITGITLPSSVSAIYDEAFKGCTSLASINIPISVMSVGANAFKDTKIWTNASNGIVYADDWAIGMKGTGIDVTLASTTEGIADEAFKGCTFSFFTFNNYLGIIGNRAFKDCTGIESMYIPQSVNIIGDYAFENCTNLCYVMFSGDSGLFTVGEGILKDCSSLSGLCIPFVGKSINATGKQALFGYLFGENTSGGGITQYYSSSDSVKYNIPSSLNYVEITGNYPIPYGAFYNCNMIVNILIYSSELQIEDYAFYGCTMLSYFLFSAIISLESIGSNAFQGCSSLKSITIPSNVTSMGSNVFLNCNSLTIYVKSLLSPPVGWSSSWNPNNRPTYWGQ